MTSGIFKVSFALSKVPYFNSAYVLGVLTVFSVTVIYQAVRNKHQKDELCWSAHECLILKARKAISSHGRICINQFKMHSLTI